jgi:hypothetical protein
MVSYVGIICQVDIRRTRSFDRFVTRLEFMAAVWREDKDSHPTMLPLLYCLYGQMQIVVVQQQNYWSLFRMLDMRWEVFYISYKMIFRHLPRWMDRVLNLLEVPRVQRQCWWGVFFVSQSYPISVYYQNKKMGLKILLWAPCLRSTFSHSSHISLHCVKACVASIWRLLASTHYLAS